MYFKEVNKIFKYTDNIKSSIMLTLLIIVIDYLNIPSQFIKKDLFLSILVFSVVFFLILFDFLASKKYSLIVAKGINIIDKKVFMGIFSILIYSIYLFFDFKIYKIVMLSIFLLIFIVLLIYRLKYIKKLLLKQSKNNVNTYDLKEFLELDINNLPDKKLILFNEKDVKYDLLDREIFINYISSLITYCSPQKSFVFALNGAWGSGKTTILNLIKNNINSDEIILIDNFDPWKYDDNETLFRAFYDSITRNKNFDFNYSLYKKFYNIYKVLILGSDNILNKVDFDVHFTDNNYSIDELKNIISSYLKINNKKVVYIIDNIDRLNKEQILTIFKTISTLFDFDNFIYLLSFDEERVNNIFEKELQIDPNYLNKIINSNINLPKTNSDTISKIAVDIIIKLFDYYNINLNISEKTRFFKMFSELTKKIVDIRELKRFLNYISAYMQSEYMQEQINIGDFIIIQLLKYLNIDLYDTIYKNSTFFISEDRNLCTNYNDEYYWTDKFNQVAKEFYTSLLEKNKNKDYKNILSTLFPYIDNYIKGYEIRTTIPFNHNQDIYNDSIINKRIFNGRYFEHYFELTPNKYAFLLKDVDEFIKGINNTNNLEKMELYFKLFILSNGHNQKFKFEILNKSLNKIETGKLINILDIIYKNINNINLNSSGATMLDARERCILIISDIFNIMEKNLAIEKLDIFVSNTNNLKDIDNLIYWLNPDKQYQRNLDNKIYEIAKTKFINKLNYYIDNNIDIIAEEYGKFSILILKKYSIDVEKIKKYIKQVLTKNNIFKFLRNFINEWIDSGYSYKFDEKSLYELVSKEKIDEIIDSLDFELNTDQQLILDIFNKKLDNEYSFAIPINYQNL